MLRGFVTAIHTLTILPVPGKDAEKFSDAIHWFAAVGAILGGILYLTVVAFEHFASQIWAQGLAALLLTVNVCLTRGFHLDGVADWADGFWGGYDRERVLAIMKDSFLGTFGVVALILLLLGKWAALTRLIETGQALWIVGAMILSRSMQVELAYWLPYARSKGTAASIVQDAKLWQWLLTIVLATGSMFLIYGFVGLAATLFAWLFTRLLGLWFVKRVGGVTGDLLGTCSEMVELSILLFPIVL